MQTLPFRKSSVAASYHISIDEVLEAAPKHDRKVSWSQFLPSSKEPGNTAMTHGDISTTAESDRVAPKTSDSFTKGTLPSIPYI